MLYVYALSVLIEVSLHVSNAAILAAHLLQLGALAVNRGAQRGDSLASLLLVDGETLGVMHTVISVVLWVVPL